MKLSGILSIAFAALVASAALLGAASMASSNTQAQPSMAAQFSDLNQSLLGASAAQINCNTNFTLAYITAVANVIPSQAAQLGQSSALLSQYTAQVNSDASGGNVTTYREYVSTVYDPGIASVKQTIKAAIKAGNLTGSQRASLVSSYNSIKPRYQQCDLAAVKSFAQYKLAYYQDAIAQYEQQANTLSAKGISVSALYADISNANATVIQPFASIVSTGNASQIDMAIRTYCLFDGCANGTNAHLAAHFDYDKLNAIISKAETFNLTSNQTIAMNSAKGYLSAAGTALVQVGTSHYRSGQVGQVWGNLKNASATLRSAFNGAS